MSQPWLQEWQKFTPQTIEEIKSHNDDTHLEKEWMSYVYEKNGRYYIGKASMGDESAISVIPAEKTAVDAATKGLSPNQKKWTIHGHPLKDGKIYNGRQYFSSVDLIDEFLEVRDSDKNGGRSRIVQYIVYPHQQKEGSKEVIHNRVRVLVFPDSKTIVKAMKQSNPSVDPFAITRDNGMNKSDSNGTTMNDMNIDWFRFQEALGKMGQMGIVDIEGKGGEHSHPLNAESMMDGFNILQKFGLLMAAFGTGFYAFGKFSKR
jgi:hypothetical protein